jgi:protoheme IX farnesyltransferase
MRTIHLYLELAKLRIVSMVLVTATLGFFLGNHGLHPLPLFFAMLFGVGCATGGAAMLNNYLDRSSDATMNRTRARALPAGLIEPARALTGGISMVLIGVMELLWAVNLLTAFLVLLAAFLYVMVYTPMKKVSWLNTTIGAFSGAIPPMAGWAAATGHVDSGAWVLFAILFAWQHPHFFAIAWMYRGDYRAAGFKMLPVVEPNGERTFHQTIVFSILLIGFSLLPTALGITGRVYLWGALLLGLGMLSVALDFVHFHESSDARRLLKASIVYLPLLLLLIVLDAN